ncbi:MAG: hypothetical protein RSG50_03360 [Clostridia bacterium]
MKFGGAGMFSLKQDALLLSLKPFDELRLVPEADDRQTWDAVDGSISALVHARAKQARCLETPQLCASDFKRFLESGDGPYLAGYHARREVLKALVMGACVTGEMGDIERIADLVYRMSEETDWALTACKPDLPDCAHTVLDEAACESGALVALTLKLVGTALDRFSPKVRSRAQWALDERIIEPLVGEGGHVWAFEDEHAPRAQAALLTVALLSARDDRRRWLAMRHVLKMLEAYLQNPTAGVLPLENQLQAAMAVNDCFSMLSVASGGEVELRDEALFVDMARAFTQAHIESDYFVNPAGSMRPALPEDLLYRLGESARLSTLCKLAALLRRVRGGREMMRGLNQPSEPLLQQVMSALGRADLVREPVRTQAASQVALPAFKLLAGRLDGLYAALYGPDSRPARACIGGTGALLLFYRDTPVVIDTLRAHSVPVVGGYGQTRGPGAQDDEATDGPGYRMLSMNVAAAYPKRAGVLTWQRTLMFAAFEGGIRLIEAFDLDAPSEVSFRFIVLEKPCVAAGQAQLGPVQMRYDAALTARVEAIEAGGEWGQMVYQLSLSTKDKVPGGNYAFLFTAPGGWGTAE